MNDNHIIHLLESAPFKDLSDNDRRTIQLHTATCDDCARAYKAAVVSSTLLKEGAGEVFEPSPFFQTRVMAAIREQQKEPRGLAKFWRAAGALVSTMTAGVALLAVLSFAVPATQTTTEATAMNGYSAEEVIFDQAEAALEHSDAEILSTIYQAEEDER
jgi:anti-sigma factor RsiW